VCCWDLCPLRRYFEIFGSAICNTIQSVRVTQYVRRETGYLTSDSDLLTILQPNGTLLPLRIIKNDCDARFRDPCLPALVYQVLLVLRAHLRHVSDTEYETDGIENVGFARAVEASDGVEARVPARYLRSDGVRFEPCTPSLAS
jgi:hypothetical protein